MNLFLLLLISGLLLIIIELFLPGGVLGAIGGLLLILSAIIFFNLYGVKYGIYYLLSLVFVVTLILVLAVSFVKHIPFKNGLFLLSSEKGVKIKSEGIEHLIGMEGVAFSVLKPAGAITINGKKYEALSEHGYLNKGCKVKVIKVENNNLIVTQV